MNIEEEIDILVDKIGTQLKSRMKKLVLKYEKQVLRDYILSVKKDTQQNKKSTQQSKKSSEGTKKTKKEVYSSSDHSSSDSD